MLVDTYDVAMLSTFARVLCKAAGLDDEKAITVSDLLLQGDLLGHTTHGLALLPRYLTEIGSGSMNVSGTPRVMSDRGACLVWDANRLPGVWVTAKALETAIERASNYGTVTIAVGNNHHIGCLAAYLGMATGRGMMAILASSDPSQASVAPFGGTRPLLTPNPIAVGIPTGGDPILIDVTASTTTNNMTSRLLKEKRRFEYPWLMDAQGNATNDPAVIATGGSILPAGGLDHGQKGYGWALLVEVLTQGLSGFGRSQRPKGWGSCVFVQIIDPTAFAGIDAFHEEVDYLSDQIHSNPPRHEVDRVRLPGERALASRRSAEKNGVPLSTAIVKDLGDWAARLNVPVPAPISAHPAS